VPRDEKTGELQRLRRLHSRMKLVFGLSALATTFVMACSAAYLVLNYGDMRGPLVPIIVAAAASIILLHIFQAMLLKNVSREIDSKIELLVLYDDLTGVYNFRYIEQRIDQEILRADRGGHSLSVIYIDSDRFKDVNDQHDHQVGNQVLRQLAELLQESVRSNDLVGRLGGDEFLALLPETTAPEARIVAQRMLDQLRQSRFITDTGARIDFLTVSLGICSYPEVAQSREELVLLADRAMYEAKKKGGDNVIIATRQQPTKAQA